VDALSDASCERLAEFLFAVDLFTAKRKPAARSSSGLQK
jgi:hypothetical protein